MVVTELWHSTSTNQRRTGSKRRAWAGTTAAALQVLALHVQGVIGSSWVDITTPEALSKPTGYDHRLALFGIPPHGFSLTQRLYYAESTLCQAAQESSSSWQSPFVLMVDRGDCTFVTKVRNAQRIGAAAVVFADNVCLCSSASSSCQPSDPCETSEPILADDGSGSDISIPSLLLLKQDADAIKAVITATEQEEVQINITLPAPAVDDRVEYDLWSTPVDNASRHLKLHWKDVAVALGNRAYFTPHMYIYDGERAGCRPDNGSNESQCYNLCTNQGRYCAVDPDDNLDVGITGVDVVKESLRRMCIWNESGRKDGVGVAYWDYLIEFERTCHNGTTHANTTVPFRDERCVRNSMQHASINASAIDTCMYQDSGGLQGDTINSMLQDEISAQEQAGLVVVPTLRINGQPIRGEFLTIPGALNAICSGYAPGAMKPKVCQQCAACDYEPRCVECSSYQGGTSSPSKLFDWVQTVRCYFDILFCRMWSD